MDIAWWAWAATIAFLLVAVSVDLVLHRDQRRVTTGEAAVASTVWVGLGIGYAGVVWAWLGGDAAGQYLAGYLIEKSLSMDNIVVIALVFTSYSVPARYQHRVLFWGVLGALAWRSGFIAVGARLLDWFEPATYLFGAFLIATGIRMAVPRAASTGAGDHAVLRLLGRVVPLSSEYQGGRFIVRRGGRCYASPLLAVLVAVETSDALFALDSIPATFGVTTEPFLVFSANAFAAIGLRALYFLIADVIGRFRYLKPGLAVVLGLVGVKLLAADLYAPPAWVFLGATAACVAAAILASVVWPAPSDAPAPLAAGTREPAGATQAPI